MSDWNDDDFVEIVAPSKTLAPLRLGFSFMGRSAAPKLSIRMDEATANELGGHHYAVKYNPRARVLRVLAQQSGRWEMVRAPRGGTFILRVPVPVGLVATEGLNVDPEFYVDRERALIDIELPPGFGSPLLLPAPGPVKSPVAALAADTDQIDAKVQRRSIVIGDVTFTSQEGDLLRLLAKRDLVTRDAAMMATADPSVDDDRGDKIIDVLIHRIRERLSKLGLYVSTIHGEGWRIPRELRSKLVKMISESDAS